MVPTSLVVAIGPLFPLNSSSQVSHLFAVTDGRLWLQVPLWTVSLFSSLTENKDRFCWLKNLWIRVCMCVGRWRVRAWALFFRKRSGCVCPSPVSNLAACCSVCQLTEHWTCRCPVGLASLIRPLLVTDSVHRWLRKRRRLSMHAHVVLFYFQRYICSANRHHTCTMYVCTLREIHSLNHDISELDNLSWSFKFNH